MKILFLGTGAADWAVKPESEMGENERRFSSLLLDDKILVDVAPQSYDFAVKMGVDMSKITDLIISHTHGDHYSKKALLNFRSKTDHNIWIWCHSGAVSKLDFTDEEAKLFDIHPLDVMGKYDVGEYKLTALAANHIVVGSPEQPLQYIIESDKKLFYGCDSGWFVANTWEYIMGQKFDAFILDATVGDKDGDFRLGTHNSIPMLRLILAAIKENKMSHENTLFVADHLARTLHADLETTKKIFAEFGMIVACDGDVIEF